MKIRHKITLWITAAGVLVCLIFSLIIFLEMLEQPYALVDRELAAVAGIFTHLANRENTGPGNADFFPTTKNFHYWIKIYDRRQKVLFAAGLAQYFDIPLNSASNGPNVKIHAPKKLIDLNQDESDNITFRVRAFPFSWHGVPCTIRIGKPMGKLIEEINDLMMGIGFGFSVATILLVGLAYFVAGKTLRPINAMTNLAREISEKNLDRRLPLGKSPDELYTLGAALNQMFDRLQFSFIRQKELLAAASHELKSPITLLRLFFEESDQRTDLPEEFRQGLAKQTSILHRMGRLVKNLLDLAALEQGNAIAFREVDLVPIVKEVLAEYDDVFTARQLEVQMDLASCLKVQGDPQQFQQMLINLVDNAALYNQPGGKIEVRLAGGKEAELSLWNTGAGIPAAKREKVFEQFYRVEKSRSRQLGGTGLGLTIVRQIITMCNGRIWVESEPGAWTRIQVRLPLA